MLKSLALLFALSAWVSAADFRVASFNIGALYTTEGPLYSLGDPGTPDFENVKSVIARIDADVVALQEIHNIDIDDEVSGTPEDLDVLAESLGYDHVYIPPRTSLDFTFRVVFLSRHPFLSTASIGSPANANELTRRFPAVRVDVAGTDNDPLIISGHLKSGNTSADRFRRAIELRRLTDYLANNHLTGDDNFVILGDFNLSDNYDTFTAAPTLPSSYNLGSDITFPVTYHIDPVDYFSDVVPSRVDLRQVDGSPFTYPTSSSAIDVMLISPAFARRPRAAEIYNSALDTPENPGLPKGGSAPAASASALASDHLAIFADLNLDSAGPYVFTAAGETIVENFANFDGTYDPSPWITTAPDSWRGRDLGDTPTPGFRAYGPMENPSLGIVPAPTAAVSFSADFINQSSSPINALEIALTARQWRAVLNGTADQLTAEIVTASGTIPIPALTFLPATHLPTGPISSPPGVLLTAVVDGLSITPGGSFQLRFTHTPGPGGGGLPSGVFVNEFHYDNSSSDSGEFVEIAVAPGFKGDLTALKLYLYSGGALYDRVHPVDTFTPGSITNSGHRLFSKFIPGLRNSDEGFALVHRQQVLQFISYEGSFTATNGPAAGLTSIDTIVNQSSATAAGFNAIRLSGNGASVADFTWTKSTSIPHSPGAPNSGQNFTAPVQSQGISIDDVSVKFLLTDMDSDGDGFTDLRETELFLTDPNNPNSKFIATLSKLSASLLQLSFPTLPGRTYRIEQCDDLASWQPGPDFSGDGNLRIAELPISPAEPKFFYRIRVILE